MKRVFFSVLLMILAISLFSQSWEGPFGLKMGLTLAQLEDFDPNITQTSDYFYRATVVPLPDPRFEFYDLEISPDNGLVYFAAFSKDIFTDDYGTELLDEYIGFQEELEDLYGNYEETDWWMLFGYGVFYEDFMYDLLYEDFDIASWWTDESSSDLPEGVDRLTLEAIANTLGSGYLVLACEFDNLVEHMRMLENTEE